LRKHMTCPSVRIRHTHTPGAIILGNEYQALGLLRQLHPRGVQCVLIDQDAWGPALFSRFRCRFHHSPRYASNQFWPWLVDLACTYGYKGYVVLPTDDEQVRQLAEHFSEVTTLFRYAGLPWDTYRFLYDKRLTYAWATRCNIPGPWTFLPKDRDDLPTD